MRTLFHHHATKSFFLIAFCLLVFNAQLIAQKRQIISGDAAKEIVKNARVVSLEGENTIKKIEFEPKISLDNILNFKETLSLGSEGDLSLVKSSNDNLGFEHLKYKQLHKGYEVLGAEMIFHSKAGQVKIANGTIIRNLNITTNIQVSEGEALEIAKLKINAHSYMWESKVFENMLKKEKGDLSATYFPKGKLVISRKRYASDEPFRLVHQFEIYSYEPYGRYNVEVDVETGDVINFYNKIHQTAETVTGSSLYNGDVQIDVDFDGTNYSLAETTRGNGIFTFDMDGGTDYSSATLFSESDNYLNDPNIRAGVSAHFGAEATYDYYLNNFGRNSFDNNGASINSYVHFDVDYFNAFWDGFRMTYGDGDGVSATALVSLDIVGHEITHAVTEYSAGLIYAYESGALNESFSDIFGQSIEFEAVPGTANWNLGDEIFTDGVSMIRSMSNPNSQGDPDTYQGINWEFGDFDNGGVHINSGVMNYWYYLLVEGGSGTNDDGYSYNVPSIGRGDAEQIAYRNLTVYLTASSGYIDARVGSELAAIDLFGENSAEHLAVIEAWNAVGVPTADPVLSVVDNHDFGDTPVGLKVKKEITVTNLGNALLAVSSITSTNPQFEVSQSTLQIPESSSAKFAISFTPSELGNTSGEITLLSNGGDATISIVGNGVEPPVISVSPSSLNEALFTGEIGIQNITIDNSTGGSNLQWEVGLDYITNSGLVKGSSYQRDVIKSSRIKSSPYEQPIKDFTSQKPTNIQAKSASGIGGKLYALDHINQLILELDPETGAILNSFDSPENIYGGPDGLAYDGSHLYFTNDFGSGNIHKIDATDGSLVATANFSNLAIDGLAHSGEFLYASDYSSFLVYKLDFDTEEVIETIDLGQYIGGGFTFAGRRNSYFVTNFGDVIYEVDAETNSILNSLIPNGTIYGLGYSNALEVLFVSNVSSGTVQALNPDDGTILYELSIGGFAGIASDEGMFHSWLKLAQNGGNLAPGESLELEVTFDATGLFGGEYSANLIIESNDPINTEVTVPVALDVTGAPDISVSSNSLDFGSQFMGAIITDTVIVSNVGTDDLIISSIEIDNTKFEYELSSDVIAPFDKALLIVTYSPDAAIEDNGSITINNNDSDESIITISLAGEGVEPPVMLLSPDTIHDDVLVGETVLQSITVDNSTGGSDLVWEMTITSDTINDLAFEKEAYADWTLAENQDCITENVCLTRGDSQGLFNAVVETSYSSTSPSGTEWARGTSDDPTSSYSTWRNTIESCPPCHLNQPLSLHLIEEDLYFDVVFTSWDEGGSGGGFSYVRSSPTPGWITSEKYQGTVPAGQLDVLQVSLDATNLLGGEYATNLLFYSNDPLNPEDTIVALLSVTGVPDISMSASTIDFGQQFVGAIITDTVIVSNDGTDDLIISSIEIDNTKFEYELSSDVIAPSDEALLIVTYSPDVVSEDNGSITINSNDSDESIITISLIGEGVEPPIMILSPDTIQGDVLVGEKVLQNITIDNSSGGSDLVWEMTITSDTINDLAFEKEAYADWTLAENQDCITENVCLTRGDSQGLFNAVIETSYSSTSPSGTEWARGTSDDPTSSYSTWRNTIESCPPCHLNEPLSLHLIEEDLYFDVVFTSWDEGGSGGGFSYVRSSPTPGWITSEKYQGTVPAGQQDVLQMSLDATNLFGGEYAANLLFYSNDPITPQDTIAALFNVTGVPDISISSSAIDFGEQFVGSVLTDSVIVSNNGSDQLIINDIFLSDETDFSLSVTSFELNPNESQTVVITYNPQVVETDNVTMTILSNDVDESSIEIVLSGESVDAPVISITPTSLSDDLFTGENTTQTLTIDNSEGGSDLVWEASITYESPSMRSSQKSNTTFGYKKFKKGEIDQRVGAPVMAGTGGPDNFGYYWVDSDEAGGPAYEWEDIANSGTNITGSMSDDNVSGPYPLGFEFEFYGNTYDEFYVSSNGFISFNSSSWDGCCSGQPIPGDDGVNNIIAWAWRDGYPFGNTYYENFSDKTIIQFDGYGLCCSESSGSITAEIILYHTGKIKLNYKTLTGSYTDGFQSVGIENIDGTDGLQVAINTEYLHDELTVEFSNSNTNQWLSMSHFSGVVPAGSAEQVNISFNAEGMDGGSYGATIIVNNNDPTTPSVEVPVSLSVTGTSDINVSTLDIDFGSHFVGTHVSDSILISNEGTDVLVISDATIEGDQEFDVDFSPFDLNPGETSYLAVSYTSEVATSSSATLHIYSNDPDESEMIISLYGLAEEPPLITINPTSLSEYLMEGEQSTQTITIDNSEGGSALEWHVGFNSSQINQFNKAGNSNISTLDGIPGGTTGIYFENDETVYVVNWENASLDRYNVTTESIEESYPIHSLPYGITFANGHLWIGDAFGIVRSYDFDGNEIDSFTLPYSGYAAIAFDGSNFLFTPAFEIGDMNKIDSNGTIIDSYINPGVQIYQLVGEGNKYWSLNGDPNSLMLYNLELSNGAIQKTDSLTIDGLNEFSYSLGRSSNKLHVVDFLGNSVALDFSNWFYFNETSGSVPAGSSQTVNVTFDASGLSEGFYESEVAISSNDPNKGVIEIPVSLEVTNQPFLNWEVQSMEVNPGVGSITILLETNLSTYDISSTANWITIDDQNKFIVIDYTENTGTRREAEILASGSGIESNFILTQIGNVLGLDHNEIYIYPNPVSSFFRINSTDVDQVSIVDIAGKQISFSLQRLENVIQIGLDNNPTGIYYVKILMEDGSLSTQKVILKK